METDHPRGIERVRYVFMAEELLRGPERDVDAVERADLRLDGGA
jgi:hypothetical protein